jgi:hypothetical protein
MAGKRKANEAEEQTAPAKKAKAAPPKEKKGGKKDKDGESANFLVLFRAREVEELGPHAVCLNIKAAMRGVGSSRAC